MHGAFSNHAFELKCVGDPRRTAPIVRRAFAGAVHRVKKALKVLQGLYRYDLRVH